VIDATGKYVMPGIVNTHMHLQDERGGVPQPFQYEMNLYLAAGATTVRDVGSDFEKAKKWRAESAAHTLIAPRSCSMNDLGRQGRDDAAAGSRGSPLREGAGRRRHQAERMDRDLLEALLSESQKLGLRTAIHNAVDEVNARDFAELGGTSIEHFYGVADAALDGIQDFRPITTRATRSTVSAARASSTSRRSSTGRSCPRCST